MKGEEAMMTRHVGNPTRRSRPDGPYPMQELHCVSEGSLSDNSVSMHVPEPPGQEPETPPHPPGRPDREIDLPPLEDEPSEIRDPEIPQPDDAPEPDPEPPPSPLH